MSNSPSLSTNRAYGSIAVFRGFDERLYITVTVGGTDQTGQLYIDTSGVASGATSVAIYLGVTGVRNNPIMTQYVNLPLQEAQAGLFTCTTYSIDLTQVCDPSSSTYTNDQNWQWNAYCKCLQGLTCNPQDLSSYPSLDVAVQLTASYYSLSSAGCGTSSSSNSLLGTYNPQTGSWMTSYVNPTPCVAAIPPPPLSSPPPPPNSSPPPPPGQPPPPPPNMPPPPPTPGPPAPPPPACGTFITFTNPYGALTRGSCDNMALNANLIYSNASITYVQKWSCTSVQPGAMQVIAILNSQWDATQFMQLFNNMNFATLFINTYSTMTPPTCGTSYVADGSYCSTLPAMVVYDNTNIPYINCPYPPASPPPPPPPPSSPPPPPPYVGSFIASIQQPIQFNPLK